MCHELKCNECSIKVQCEECGCQLCYKNTKAERNLVGHYIMPDPDPKKIEPKVLCIGCKNHA